MSFLTKGVSSFRKIQIALAWWGVVVLLGGWLHDYLLSPGRWSVDAVLWLWAGLTLLGLLGYYLFAPETLESGMLFLWGIATIIPLLLTWFILYPLNGSIYQLIPSLWHGSFALAYLITGYYMDRCLWILAVWEIFWAVLMVLICHEIVKVDVISNNQGLTLGLTSGLPLILAALPVWKPSYKNM